MKLTKAEYTAKFHARTAARKKRKRRRQPALGVTLVVSDKPSAFGACWKKSWKEDEELSEPEQETKELPTR